MPAPKLYTCTNVAFAAYLELRGYSVVKLDVEKPGKGVFYFDIGDKDLNTIRCEWSGSPEANFNDRLNRMKSLTY